MNESHTLSFRRRSKRDTNDDGIWIPHQLNVRRRHSLPDGAHTHPIVVEYATGDNMNNPRADKSLQLVLQPQRSVPLSQLAAHVEMLERTQNVVSQRLEAMNAQSHAQTKMLQEFSTGRKAVPVSFLLEHNGRFACLLLGAELFLQMVSKKLNEYKAFYFHRWVRVASILQKMELILKCREHAITRITNKVKIAHFRFTKRAFKVWKRRAQRKTKRIMIRRKNNGARVIQHAFRCYLVRCSDYYIAQKGAAIHIQRLFRGGFVRSWELPAIKVQRFYLYYRYRRWIYKYVYAYMNRAPLWTGICRFQALVRKRSAFNKYITIRKSVSVLQRTWRNFASKRIHAASTLQAKLCQRVFFQIRLRRHEAASGIQKWYLEVARQIMIVRRTVSATRIQSWWRMLKFFLPFKLVTYNKRRQRKRDKVAVWGSKIDGKFHVVSVSWEWVHGTKHGILVSSYSPDTQTCIVHRIGIDELKDIVANFPPINQDGRRSTLVRHQFGTNLVDPHILKRIVSNMYFVSKLNSQNRSSTKSRKRIAQQHTTGRKSILPMTLNQSELIEHRTTLTDHEMNSNVRSLTAICQGPRTSLMRRSIQTPLQVTDERKPQIQTQSSFSESHDESNKMNQSLSNQVESTLTSTKCEQNHSSRESVLVVVTGDTSTLQVMLRQKPSCQTAMKLNGTVHIVSITQQQRELIVMAYNSEHSSVLKCSITQSYMTTLLLCHHDTHYVDQFTTWNGPHVPFRLVEWCLGRIYIAPWYSVVHGKSLFRGVSSNMEVPCDQDELELFCDWTEQHAAHAIVICWRKYRHRMGLRERLKQTLSKQRDPASGSFYYFNPETGLSSWEKPAALGDDDIPTPRWEWIQHYNEEDGNVTYFNPRTGWTLKLNQSEAVSRIQKWYRNLFDCSVLRSTSDIVRTLRIVRKAHSSYLIDPERFVSKVNYFLCLFAVDGNYEMARPLCVSLLQEYPNNPVILYASSLFTLSDPDSVNRYLQPSLHSEVMNTASWKSLEPLENQRDQADTDKLENSGLRKLRHEARLLHMEVSRRLARAEAYNSNGEIFNGTILLFRWGLIKHPASPRANAHWGLLQQWILRDTVLARKYIGKALRLLDAEIESYSSHNVHRNSKHEVQDSEMFFSSYRQTSDWDDTNDTAISWNPMDGNRRNATDEYQSSENDIVQVSTSVDLRRLWIASRVLL